MLQKQNLLTLLMLALASTLLIFNACEKDEDDDPTNETTVTDFDGNVYSTAQIGSQIWMTENLKTTTYNDGTPIALSTADSAWENNTTGAYCWYNNDEATYADSYGALYNWHAIETGKLCPEGWHVPSDIEWIFLEIDLGMSNAEADGMGWRGTNEGSMLAGNINLWTDGELNNNSEFDKSGFNALPASFRNTGGTFYFDGATTVMWSSTEDSTNSVWVRLLLYNNSSVNRDFGAKGAGFSVRCLKD